MEVMERALGIKINRVATDDFDQMERVCIILLSSLKTVQILNVFNQDLKKFLKDDKTDTQP